MIKKATTYYKQPYEYTDNGYSDILAYAENLHASGDARELGHSVADVGKQQPEEQEERQLDAGVFPDQVRETLSRNHPHAGVHLLNDNEHDKRRYERPQKPVAVVGARNGIGGYAAGVIVDAAGYYSGPEYG